MFASKQIKNILIKMYKYYIFFWYQRKMKRNEEQKKEKFIVISVEACFDCIALRKIFVCRLEIVEKNRGKNMMRNCESNVCENGINKELSMSHFLG